MVNLNTLEAEKKKAQEEKEGNIVEAQIEVYENQNYEARNDYADAKAKRGKSRAKLPEKIPEDSTFNENLLQAQYAKMRAVTQTQSDQVDEYTAEIKSQQKAKETIQVLDRELPQLYKKAEQEVESVKESVYVTAKETATKTQNALIQSYSTQIKTESERRSAEIQAVDKEWDSNKSPWYKDGKQFGGYMERDNDSRKNTWIKNQRDGKASALASVRKSHLDADGWKATSINRGGFIPYPTHPTAKKLYTGEALNQHAVKALQSGTTPSNRWTRYQVEISRANQAVYAGGSLSAHASAVQSAKNTFDGLELKEQKSNSAKARVESVNQRSQDQKHWNEVISNPSTSGANQTAITALGLSHNVNELNASGVSSIYNVGDMTKAGFLPTSATVTLNTTSPYKKVGDRIDTITTRTNTSSDSRTNEENIIQKQYVKDLRDGKVGLASSLLTQRTAGGYTGKNTVNLPTFLAERGYDLSRPETIPDSVFKPVKYNEARKQASYSEKTNTTMGDLRNLIPPIQGVSSSTLQTRQKANAERAGILGTVSKQADMSFAKDKVFGTGSITIQKNASSTNLIASGKFDPFNADPIKAQETKGYTWTVSIPNREKIPTMSGGVFEANAPPTEHTFNSEKEAKLFAKSSQPKVFSGTDNDTWNKFNYRSAVKTGELPHPSTTPSWNDEAKFYGNAILDPVKTVGYGVANLILPEDKKIPVYESGSGQLIGGTIEDVISGDPLKGTGVKNAWEYVKADPIGTVLEMPAEAVMWVAGGKAVQGITKGAVAVKSTLAVSKVIPQPLKTVGTKIESGVKAVQKAPENIWLKGTEASTTLKSIDKTIANVGGQRVGLTTAMNLRYTLGGRKFLKEAKAKSRKVNPAIPLMDGKIFKISRVNDPVNIVNKNIIDIPNQASDEGILHLRGNIVTDSPAVKVGNVQQYYKSATPSFTNVPRQGLQFPKAPKLPSLDSARNWITKTKQNVKRVEQGGYKVMLSGGNTKLKVAEKSQKAKDNILDAKQIARDEINYAKEDLSLLSKQKMIKYSDGKKQMISEVTESAKKTLVDPISKAKMTDNAWGKLSKFKAETKDKLRRKKESITDRPATQDVILYRQSGTTTGTDSIIKSMPEGLSVKATPIKTVRTQTTTPTDYTTGLAKKQTLNKNTGFIDERTIKGGVAFENKTPVLFTGKVDKGIPIIGEQVKIPYKDLKGIEKTKGSEENLFDIGSYPTLEKGKLVQKKLKVKALQQEDADKTLIQRNTLTGTGEKIQESSVREWGGTRKMEMLDMNKKKVIVDVAVGGQKSDVILGSLEKKVLTTKLSQLPKKKTPTVQSRQTTQDDSGSVFTAESITGNPTTGSTGGYGKIKPEGTGTYDPRTGTTTIPKINAVSSPVKGKAKLVMKEYSSTLKSAKSPYNSAYTGGAIGEVTFTSSILTPKDMIKTGVDTNSASITGVQGKIDTSVKQDSVQKLNTDTVTKLNTRSGLRSKTSIKLDTGLKIKQMTKTAQIPLLKTPIYSRQQTPKVLPIILPRIALKETTRRGKKGKKAGFIGNVRLDNIMGMYKRKEITYGESKVTKLERQDARLTSGTSNRISMPASGLLATKKKKKKKSTSVFGGGKDEFKGFGSKKKGKKKSSLFG